MLISIQPDSIGSNANLFTPKWLQPLIEGTAMVCQCPTP